MMSDIFEFTVSFPTKDGFIGRECKNLDCKRYFQVHKYSIKSEMFCPYCGIKFSNNELMTEDQIKYAREVTEEKAREYALGEIDKMFQDSVRRISTNKYFKFTYKPINYRAKEILPSYTEHQVDSELVCPECRFRFQVYGIFGYCPGCRYENLMIYDANLEIIKREVVASQDPHRALRYAYGDLVSTFELFSKRKAKLFTDEVVHFQELFEVRKLFKKHFGIDLFKDIQDEDLLTLRRIFQKRHAYEHNQGLIEEKYVRKVPEDANLINHKAELSLDELVQGALVLRLVLDKMLQAIYRRSSSQNATEKNT